MNKSIAIVRFTSIPHDSKVHIDSWHESESITMMRHSFVHQWINEWMNWPTSRCSDQTDDSYDRLTINHNLNWCHSLNEVKNVSFRWTLMVSSHLDDHYHSLSPTTDSLSGIAFTIVMLTWLGIVGLITESNDDNCFFWSPRFRGGRLIAQWVSEWELLFVHDALFGCFDEWFWITAEQKRSTAVYTS